MKNTFKLFIIALTSLFMFGCNDEQPAPPPAAVKTTVNVVSHALNAEDFDLASVVAKLQTGDLEGPKKLQDFINNTPGINNVDIDNDKTIDAIYVTEEKGESGQVLVAKAYPKTGDPVVVMEASFTKTATGDVRLEASYPQHVAGHNNHYHSHTLTGSVIGDMMFYRYLFQPHPLYMPMYGSHSYASRATMSRSQVTTSRNTYRTTNKVVSPTPKAKPKSFSPKSKAAKTANKSFASKRASGGTLSSKKGATKSYNKRNSAKAKPKANSYRKSAPSKSTPSKPTTRKATPRKATPRKATPRRTAPRKRSSWGSSGSSRSSRSSRRSSAEFKNSIQYLSDEDLAEMAETLYSLPVATWNYNVDENDDPDRQRLGIIVEDASGASNSEHLISGGDHVDLYGYTSLAVIAAQVQKRQLDALKAEVQELRDGICK